MKKKNVLFGLCGLLSLFLVVGGCGYSLGSLVPAHIKTVYVEVFDNETHERNIETEICTKIKEYYNWNGTLKIANSKEQADALLDGAIIDYVRQPARYSELDNKTVDEYKLVLVVDLKFKDLVKDRLMWSEQGFTGEAYYVVSGTPASTETRVRANSEIDAFDFAARDLAQNIVDRTIEGW